jgi:hypothetical protein
MTNEDCEYSAAIISATKRNQWTDPLRAHLAACPRCQETMEVKKMMNKFAAEGRVHTLPNYRIVWLKAQYARRQERISALDLVGLIGIALGGVGGLIGLSAGMFPRPFAALVELTGRSLPALTDLFSNNAPLAVMIGVAVMVWLVTRDSIFAER